MQPQCDDNWDFSGYAGQNLDAFAMRAEATAALYLHLATLWGGLVAILLLCAVWTGDWPFFAVGYPVTLMFVWYCYQVRAKLDRVDELNEWCEFRCPS